MNEKHAVNIDKLKPGPETDKLVADAIGIEYETMGYELYRYTDVGGALFQPSRDLNDAFGAAERADLFGCHERFLGGSEIWKWHDGKIETANEPPTIDLWISAETPAMAICKAILALKAK